MWGQQPRRDFGLDGGDQAILEEVLDLLVTTSPGGCQGRAADTDFTGGSNPEPSGRNLSPSISDGEMDLVLPGIAGDEAWGATNLPNEANLSTRSFEENRAAVYRAGQDQKQEDEALGLVHNSIPSFSMPLTTPQLTKQPMLVKQQPLADRLSTWSPPFINPGLVVSEASAALPSYSPPVSQRLDGFPVPPVQSVSTRMSSQPDTYRRVLEANVNVLSTGQRVRVLDAAGFDKLRRKLRMQTASRRFRKRKKQVVRQRKKHIQELQAELGRLQKLEAQSNQYEHRTVESLEEEFNIHKAEVSDLTGKVQDAAKEELEWINTMRSHVNEWKRHR